MKLVRPTIKIHARTSKVDETVARGRQMFQVDAEPNEVLEGRALTERFAKKIKVDVSEANYIIESLQEFVLEELQSGNRLDFELVSFLPQLSGTLPSRDANPTDAGLAIKGHVKARPALRNALKGRLITTPEWGAIRSLMDVPLKLFDKIVIGHLIHLAGFNMAIDPDQPDEGIWLENGRGEVVSRAQVGYSDAQIAECCFGQSVEPGKYTIVLANRASKKGSDYKLCRHCRAVEVCREEPAK